MKFFNVLNRMRPQKYVTVTKPYHIHLIYSVDPNIYCACPENIHKIPSQKGLEFPGGSIRPKNLKKYVKLYWNFQRVGRGGFLEKQSLPWGRYGYFLELHTNTVYIIVQF